MATLFDENSNMTALSALNGVTAGPSTAGTNAMNSNHLVNQLLSVKDSRWLQIEVCREYQRGQCSRNEQECKYAHPPAHVDVQNGRVTACYDSIKGRCTRENPKCKYLHPPQHLKDQLLQAGRNNLALKNLLCSQLTQPTALPTMMPGQIAHLVQQPPTQQPLVPTLPFIPSYLTLPAGYHTLISAAPNGGADPYQTPPAIMQQLALLQAQSPTNQPQLMLGSPAAAGAQNQLLNQALGAQNLAAMQQASLQQAFLQQLQQQQQLAALYGNSLAGGGAPSPLANFHTVASSMPSSMPNNSITTPESVTSHNSRKRRLDSNLPNGSGHNNSSSLSAHDSTSLFAATGLLNSTHASGTGGGSGSAAGAAASSITPIASATTDSTAGLVALQNQLLLAAAANGNGPIPMKRSALDKNGIAVTSAQTQGLHIYAQHAAQFNPYLMQQALPGYIPVSFAGQLPPRF